MKRLVTLAVIAASLFMVTRVSRLEVEVDPDSQLPQRHPYIQALNRLHAVFGEKNLVFIGLFPTTGTIYRPAFLAKVKRISDRIEALPGVVPRTFLSLASAKAVDIRATGDGMQVQAFLEPLPTTDGEANHIRERVTANPQYLGTIVAKDGAATAIVADVDFTAALPGYPEVRDAIRAVLADEQDGTFTARLGGPAIYVAALADYSARMFYFFPLALLVIGIVHYEAFRTLQALFLPLLTALLAMLWSLGLLGALGVALDPFNVMTPILILAVAAGHAVQMLKRFYEELADVHEVREAVVRAMSRVGPVMIIAAMIAALSFLSLLTFETRSIRNFGLFTALGILSALLIEMTLIPALRSLLPPPKARESLRQDARHVFDAVTEAIAKAVSGAGARRVLAVAFAVAIVSAALGSRVVVDSSFRRQFFPTATVRSDDAELNRAFAGTSTIVLLIEGESDGALDEPALLAAIDRLQAWAAAQPHVGKTLSFVDYVKRMHAAMNAEAPPKPLPETRNLVAQYLLVYSLSGSVEDFDSLIDPRHRTCALRIYLDEDSTRFGSRMIARLRDEADRALPRGYGVRVTGSLASSDALNEVMVHGKLANIVQIGTIILAIASIAVGSLVGGFLVAIPLALAVLTNFGAMGLFGQSLDIGTSTISAMAVGIGADYGIYFLYRLREELARGVGLDAAVGRTLATSGKAILFVSSAIAAGYATLCFSGFGYHIRLGILVAFAMMVSSLGSLTVLPALVLTMRPAFLLRAARTPLERPAVARRGEGSCANESR
jgi:uncharacterized protein